MISDFNLALDFHLVLDLQENLHGIHISLGEHGLHP